MKSLTFIRGVGLAGALTLTHAAVAFGATSHATTTSTQPVESAKALAQSTGENQQPHLSGGSVATHVASSSGGGASIVRTIVGLFIVIAVIYGIAWIMKQAKKSKTRPTGHGLSQVASLPLGRRALGRCGKSRSRGAGRGSRRERRHPDPQLLRGRGDRTRHRGSA